MVTFEEILPEIEDEAERILPLPDLAEIQTRSYQWFLNEGLRDLLQHFSTIEDYTGNISIEFRDYRFGEPKKTVEECRESDATYEMPLYVKVFIINKETAEVKESEVYFGEIPKMTERGTFIINGSERVVISQLSRSPGVYFRDQVDASGRVFHAAQIIPAEGPWTDIEIGPDGAMHIKIGQLRKFPVTLLLRALQWFPSSVPDLPPIATHIDILRYFGKRRRASLRELAETVRAQRESTVTGAEPRSEFYSLRRVADAEGTLLEPYRHFDPTDSRLRERLRRAQIEELEVLEVPHLIRATLRAERELIYRDLKEHHDRLWKQVLDQLRKSGAYRPELAKCWLWQESEDSYVVLVGRGQTLPEEEIQDAVASALAAVLGRGTEPPAVRLQPVTASAQDRPELEELAALFHPFHALISLYLRLRPGETLPVDLTKLLPAAEQAVRSFFFDPRRYDLSRVGRHKMNRRLNIQVPETVRSITAADILAIAAYLIGLQRHEGRVDDIDHLQNKRVRAVGELVQNQMRLGLLRMERVAKERMAASSPEELSAQLVLSVKPLQAAINSFFGSGQLSQFMDQVNPLSELAHKRRLSAMGPGGLSRQSAKLEVRDVHHSHYGRICPIETPEGANVGLIGYLALYAQLDEFGFILTPYRRVVKGRVTDEVVFLGPDEEEHYYIASASEPRDRDGRFINKRITVRRGSEFPTVDREQVDFCDLSAKQVFSIATALIPFLENCDAVRALAGSNMQRQAVPLIMPERPRVGTGLEERAARDSGTVVVARQAGRVVECDASHIVIETSSGQRQEYRLQKFARTNMSTCLNQRPLVRVGQRVSAGQVIADGAATSGGYLALGRNLLVAFLSWEGYNYEDAIVVSERVVREDLLTSIHIEKYECEARTTKLGPEEITRDIPNVGEDALAQLDDNGVVRVGSEVRPEDILVGRVAPKGQSELTAEERLVIAIFGKKAEEMRDVSLRVPHGSRGIVIGTQIFSRYKYECRECGKLLAYGKPAEVLECPQCGGRLRKLAGDDLKPGVNQKVRVFVAQRRKLQVGDKLTGRHGNKGVVARIVPEEDMPFLPDGRPIDVCLNPLSVPSRMNLGQLLEAHLGYVGEQIGRYFVCPVFESYRLVSILAAAAALEQHMRAQALRNYALSELNFLGDFIDAARLPEGPLAELEDNLVHQLAGHGREALEGLAEWLGIPRARWQRAADASAAAQLIVEQAKENSWRRVQFIGSEGKSILYDGRTGEPFHMPVTVGSVYLLKLNHMVEDKIHARSTGPYSLITQQPLGGKAQMGGQRFGEMEVWVLEAYGAAYSLQEMLTIKSDDVRGRVEAYEAIVKGEDIGEPGVPESFKILVREMQSLALDVKVYDRAGNAIDLAADVEEGR
jgi:DNA-directed RNA polymerase subunit beta